MKAILIYFGVFSFGFFLTSCNKDESPQFLQTTVKGKSIDQVRNTVYSNDTIILSSNYSCGSGFNIGFCSEVIETAITDSNGAYEFTFDFDVDKGYNVRRISNNKYFETEEFLPLIKPGLSNTIDINGWLPVILKVNLSVTNNVFPDLRITPRDYLDNLGIYSFPSVDISEENINTTLYLQGKPRTQMDITFEYTDDNPENISHQLIKSVITEKEDTISVSYEIDCSSF